MRKEKIGLALSGGAARGYAEIPVLAKIQKENIKIDIISGSSAGALIGAYFALYGEIDSFVEKLNKVSWKEWLSLIDLNNPKKSLIKGKKVKKFLEKNFFGNKEFKDTKIKLIVVATDVETLKPIYITKRKIIDAIMASIAMPGIFPTVKKDGKILTDGQVSEHLPVNILFKKGATKVIGFDVLKNIKIDLEEIEKSNFNLLLSLFYRSLITSHIPEKNVFIFEPNFRGKNVKLSNNMRFDKIKNNLEIGEKEVNKKWKEFQKWIKK